MNTDGAAKGKLGPTGGGAIFREKSSVVLGCFTYFYGICDAFHAELSAAIIAIKLLLSKDGIDYGWRVIPL